MALTFIGLVSGYGTSLRPLTNYIKKEMYPILDKPFLAYMLENVRSLTDHVVLLVGPMSEQVKTYFGSYYKNLQIFYAEQPDPQGTMDALIKVHKQHRIEESIVWLGDTYISKGDLDKVYNSSQNVLTIKKVDFKPKTPVIFNREGEVSCCWNCTSPYANVGVYKFNKTFLKKLEEKRNGEWRILEMIQSSIDSGNRFLAVQVNTWMHMGDKEGSTFISDLKRNQQCLKELVDYFYKEVK